MRLDFLQYYGNTILVTFLVTVIMLFIGSLSAFAFARMEFPFKNFLFFMLLTVFMVPAQMTMIPKYLIISRLHWVDTLWALVVPNVFDVYAAAVSGCPAERAGRCRKNRRLYMVPALLEY